MTMSRQVPSIRCFPTGRDYSPCQSRPKERASTTFPSIWMRSSTRRILTGRCCCYQVDGSLIGSRYRGEPEKRTVDRDNAVEIAPVRSLESTFSKLPPSARRSTVRLRGGRGRKSASAPYPNRLGANYLVSGRAGSVYEAGPFRVRRLTLHIGAKSRPAQAAVSAAR